MLLLFLSFSAPEDMTAERLREIVQWKFFYDIESIYIFIKTCERWQDVKMLGPQSEMTPPSDRHLTDKRLAMEPHLSAQAPAFATIHVRKKDLAVPLQSQLQNATCRKTC